jgi:hypothetical protein
MSIPALVVVLGASVVTGRPDQSDRMPFLELSSSVLATETSVMTTRAPAIHREATRNSPEVPINLPAGMSPRPDLAVYLGDPQTGPELELGALGGGQVHTSGVVHVGFGMDF